MMNNPTVQECRGAIICAMVYIHVCVCKVVLVAKIYNRLQCIVHVWEGSRRNPFMPISVFVESSQANSVVESSQGHVPIPRASCVGGRVWWGTEPTGH